MHLLPDYVAQVGGVASTTALHAAGFAPAEIASAIRSLTLARVARGWVGLPTAPAVLVDAVRVGGRLSCVSVLQRHGVWTEQDARPHVRIGRHAGHSPAAGPRRANARFVAGPQRVLHRALTAQPLGATAVDPVGIALAHAVMCQPRMDAVASLDSAANRGLFSMFELAELLDPLPAKYARLFDLIDPGCQSGLETKARLGLRAARIPHRTQVAVSGVGRVDILIGDRLVLELDGRPWHSETSQLGEDYRRDLALLRRGYVVVRLNYWQVTFQWSEVIAAIRQMVALDEHRWQPRHRRAGLCD